MEGLWSETISCQMRDSLRRLCPCPCHRRLHPLFRSLFVGTNLFPLEERILSSGSLLCRWCEENFEFISSVVSWLSLKLMVSSGLRRTVPSFSTTHEEEKEKAIQSHSKIDGLNQRID